MENQTINVYGTLYKKERDERIRSGKTKEERTAVYHKTSVRLTVLKTLSQWSPIRNSYLTGSTNSILFKDLTDGKVYVETFQGLSYEHLLEVGRTLSDNMSRLNETSYEWHVAGYNDTSPEKSRDYKRDTFMFKATSYDKEYEGEVKAYTMNEALTIINTKLGDNIEKVEVYNPMTSKRVESSQEKVSVLKQ